MGRDQKSALPGVRGVTVPRAYETPNGTRFKARANHYALTLRDTAGWVLHLDDDTCEAVGRARVDKINSVMGFDLPESEDFDTIGGFVFAEFGRVPAAGESIVWQDAVRLTVLEATRRRVDRVRLERVRQESLEAV